MMEFISRKHNCRSFSLSAENKTGEKGKGGMATEGYTSFNSGELGQGWKVDPFLNVPAESVVTIADIKGQGAVRHIWMTSGSDARDLILRFYWDGSKDPSVEVPMGDFFAAANYRDEHRQVSSLAVCVNAKCALNCYWEMPYRTGCRITVENLSPNDQMLAYQIDCEEKEVGEDALYFHAQFRRVNPVPFKEVYTIVDNLKGRGQYVGTYMFWASRATGWWGEGEIKFYIDGDTDFPTICGTGTEDYFCGAWGFYKGPEKYEYFCTPYTGFDANTMDQETNCQKHFNLYRWHIQDPVYFNEDLRVTIQDLGWSPKSGKYLPLQDDLSSVAYWYSDNLNDEFPELPDREHLRII